MDSEGRKGWLRLSARPRQTFATTPLGLALCQVRFPAVLTVANPGQIALFQRQIEDVYPVASQVQQIDFTFAVGTEQPKPSMSVVWRFADVVDDWAVAISTEFVSLETRAYIEFKDFADRFSKVLEALASSIHPRFSTRVGLRYVNEVRPGGVDWGAVIRAELLGALAHPDVAPSVAQCTQVLLLENGTNQKLRVQHGLVPSGSTIERRPNSWPPLDNPYYLIDLDAYQEFRQDALPSFAPAEILAMVEENYANASQFFRWSITDEYASSLGSLS